MMAVFRLHLMVSSGVAQVDPHRRARFSPKYELGSKAELCTQQPPARAMEKTFLEASTAPVGSYFHPYLLGFAHIYIYQHHILYSYLR